MELSFYHSCQAVALLVVQNRSYVFSRYLSEMQAYEGGARTFLCGDYLAQWDLQDGRLGSMYLSPDQSDLKS